MRPRLRWAFLGLLGACLALLSFQWSSLVAQLQHGSRHSRDDVALWRHTPGQSSSSRPSCPYNPFSLHLNDSVNVPPEMLALARGQHGEDFTVMQLFHNATGGLFVEIGAHDGLDFSNTLLLERALNWRGLLVEANPEGFSSLQENRPGQFLVHSAVCARPTTLHWASRGSVSGIFEFMPEAFRQIWHSNVTAAESLPEVECVPMQVLLDRFELCHVDFFSLDVESAELEVVRSIDFSRFTASIFVVEADARNPSKDQLVRDHLAASGYEFLGSTYPNDWFAHRDFLYHHIQLS